MRIVIDLQGAQSEANGNRGIGRYSLALAQSIARNRGPHEVIIALSDLLPDSVEAIRQSFEGLVPHDHFRVWTAPGPTAHIDPENAWRRGAAELTRETFLASLEADVVLVSSLFEGLVDNAVTSVGRLPRRPPTAVVLFDLIPLLNPELYLSNPVVKDWYFDKVEHLRRADLLLAISDSSRQEVIEQLRLPKDRCISISTDANPHFVRIDIDKSQETDLRKRYGLHRHFVMYTGGIDHRKNIDNLIRSFADIPLDIRIRHQLAIVCSVQEQERARLNDLAKRCGLASDELVMTGFVPEDDLVGLYNLCDLFVFPSWHEGFGLPVLEAMRCGARVIGANASSIPEVVGLSEALFDPHSQQAITDALLRGLTDEGFRSRLVQHAAVQSGRFSWDRSAQTAIAAMAKLHEQSQTFSREQSGQRRRGKPRLAFVSPLPPSRTGIADYSSELLRVLSNYYRIDVVIDRPDVSDPWINRNCDVRRPEWLITNAELYDRVLYHFGNSEFHQFMFDLLEKVPGVVVLHDFFLSGIVAHMDVTGLLPGSWPRELYHSHGYPALKQRFAAADSSEVVWAYPCSASVVRNSLGIIVHSPNSLRLARQWYGEIDSNWAVIPHLRDMNKRSARASTRKELGLTDSDFVVCSFGIIGQMKHSLRLANVWKRTALAHNPNCHLIFVGENNSGPYGSELSDSIRGAPQQNVRITGWVDTVAFQNYLSAADMAVQLRTLSRGETSGAVLDCMKYGLPTIVNANGSMADLDESAVWRLPDHFTDEQLAEALERLWGDSTLRQGLGEAAQQVVRSQHDPARCAEQYRDAIERIYDSKRLGWRSLPAMIASLPEPQPDTGELLRMADAVGLTFPAQPRQRQLLVDISALVQFDAKTGIQRVVRNVLKQWLNKSIDGLRVEPVYATDGGRYRYARQFTCRFLECPSDLLDDDVIEFASGDVFFGLDLQPQIVVSQSEFYKQLQRHGVRVAFAVYDLLCVRMPQHFFPGAHEAFTRWLSVIAGGDDAICISKSVAMDLGDWVAENAPHRVEQLSISSFQLGADLDLLAESGNLPDDAGDIIERLTKSPSFLMVGTVEPRKGHRQALAAFEALWERGNEINLVILGKPGWQMEETCELLRAHPRRGRQIFWLESVSDEYLERIYAASDCLLAASEGEGFGLPLIEAARHGLPILARDIAVFREVAGDHAAYFAGLDPSDLVRAIENWLKLYQDDRHPKPTGISWVSWRESAEQLMAAVLNGIRQ